MAALIVLESSDHRQFKVHVNIAKMSITIKNMLDNLGDLEKGKEEIIPVLNVTGDILEKVLQWAEYHYKLKENTLSKESCDKYDADENKNGDYKDEMNDWNKQFFKIDNETLFAITRAANYLDMESLLNICCVAVANLIRGKTSRQIREELGLTWPNLQENH